MSRDRFFCGLFVLAVANGLQGFVLNTIATQGWFDALLGLFGISAVVWIACFAAAMLLYGSRLDEVIITPDAVIGIGRPSDDNPPLRKNELAGVNCARLLHALRFAWAVPAEASCIDRAGGHGPDVMGPRSHGSFRSGGLAGGCHPRLHRDWNRSRRQRVCGCGGKSFRDLPAVFFPAWHVDRCSGLDHD